MQVAKILYLKWYTSFFFLFYISVMSTCFKTCYTHSEHPKSLKTSIPYRQAWRIKSICSKTTDFEYHLQELKERHVNQGSNKKSIDQQFSKVKTLDRHELLKEKTHDQETQNKTALVLTYSRFLPNISNIGRKHWNIHNISRTLQVLTE